MPRSRKLLQLATLLGWTSFVHLVAGRPLTAAAMIQVSQPPNLAPASLALLADFSANISFSEPLATWVPEGNGTGCAPYTRIPAEGIHGIAVVRRGDCTFAQKALHAQSAGVAGLIIVWDTDNVKNMGGENASTEADKISIVVIAVKKTLGDQILSWNNASTTGDTVNVSVVHYQPYACDLSEVFVVVLATFLVALGAFISTADLRPGSPLAPSHQEDVLELSRELAWAFFFVGSLVLTLLYYFMRYIVYVVIGAFCLGSFGAVTVLGSAVLPYNFPMLQKQIVSLPLDVPIMLSDVLAASVGLSLVGGWLVLRHTPSGWFFQDALGSSVLCMMQRTLKLPSMKIATLLLTLMFLYDIFWVFISPLLFQKSVMVHVATGGTTGEAMPMLLRMPAILDPLGSERMLGFGDIVLPGLLVSYLLRHDMLGNKGLRHGYFMPAVVGYAAGLGVTMVVLVFMHHGQPALLYLVPSTLGTALALAFKRGEFTSLWNSAYSTHKQAVD